MLPSYDAQYWGDLPRDSSYWKIAAVTVPVLHHNFDPHLVDLKFIWDQGNFIIRKEGDFSSGQVK